jgi:phage shock protein A
MSTVAITFLVSAIISLLFGDLLIKLFIKSLSVVTPCLLLIVIGSVVFFGGSGFGLYALVNKVAVKANPVAMYELAIAKGESKIENAKKLLVNIKAGEKDTQDDIAKIDTRIKTYEGAIVSNKSNERLINRYARSIVVFEQHKNRKEEQLTNYKVAYDEAKVRIEEAEEKVADAKAHLEDLQLQLTLSDSSVQLSTLDVNLPDFSDFDLMEKEIRNRLNHNEAVLEVTKEISESAGGLFPKPEDRDASVAKILDRVLKSAE